MSQAQAQKEHCVKGLSTHRAVLVTIGSAAMIAICFLVSAINRECTGRVQEKVNLLERAENL